MTRLRFARALALTWVALSLPVGRTAADDWPLTGNLGAHDPTLLREGNTWWVATTGAGTPIKYSSDGKSWTQGRQRFPGELPWWRTYAPGMGSNDVWAPDLHAFNGRVWMYYAVSAFGTNNSAIGLTSASSVAAGDWRDDGLVLSSRAGAQAYNAIDPSLVIDAAGAPWLVFGSWFSGIQLTRLDPGTMKPTGAITRLAARSGGIEGPNVVYANGWYYLFVSIDRCCQGVSSTYKIAYGRSSSITGPYLDRNGVSLTNGGGSVLEQSSGRYVGPGGQSVVQVGAGWVLVRHFYDANANGAPTLRIGDLYWDAGGWPTLSRPSGSDPGTTYRLTVTRAGTGSGAIGSSPSGIACGATCSASYASGASVTLTAAAAAGSTFAGWGGDCVGTGACSTTMTAARTVTATFAATAGTAPCANPVTFAGQSGSLGTGAACLRTATAVNGWGCSNFDGRSVGVNGGTPSATCGAGPFPLARAGDGYTYFAVTAGTYPWASLYAW